MPYNRIVRRSQFAEQVTAMCVGMRFLGLLSMLVAATLAQAATATGTPFDHFTTGFELDGMHRSVDCESCHVQGVFKGTPRTCARCHDGSNRVANSAKSPRHMMTTAVCEACHTTLMSWNTVATVDHDEVVGTCQSCHNGTYANPKPVNHPPTSNDCEQCHNTYLVDDGRVQSRRASSTTVCAATTDLPPPARDRSTS